MRKNITIITIFIFSILLISCGYKKINQKNNTLIYIQSLNIIGEKKIGNKLRNNITLISNPNSENKYDIKIILKKNKTIKIKNTTGKATRYGITVSANVFFKNIIRVKNFNKSFAQSSDYDIAKNHSDTMYKEINAENTVVDQLSNQIINFITTYHLENK